MANFLGNSMKEINKENSNEAERMLFGNVSPNKNQNVKQNIMPSYIEK